jgi:hypothetical protein
VAGRNILPSSRIEINLVTSGPTLHCEVTAFLSRSLALELLNRDKGANIRFLLFLIRLVQLYEIILSGDGGNTYVFQPGPNIMIFPYL